MPKTQPIEKLQTIRRQGLKGSTTEAPRANGSSTFRLVEKNDTSDATPPFSPPKSPEAKPLPSSTVNSPGTDVAFGWERFFQIAHELPSLFVQHWKELALNQDVIPLDPDWDKYYALDVAGILRILTVRVPSGQLVGYVFLMAGPHLHYRSTLWAHVDMFWMDPVYRQGWTGVRLFKTLIKDAKVMGVVNLTLATKLHFMDDRVSKLLRRLGFMPIETIHAMRLV